MLSATPMRTQYPYQTLQLGFVLGKQYGPAVDILINLALVGGGAWLGYRVGRRSWAGAALGAFAGYGAKCGVVAVGEGIH